MYLPCGAPTCSNDTERLQSMVHEHYIQLTSVWATQHTIAFMQWRNTQVCWSRTRRDNEKRRCPHMAMSDLWTTKNLFLATLICCIPFIILRQPDKEWRKQISRCVKCCPAFHPFFIFDLFALSSTAFSFNCMPKKNTIYVEKQWTKKNKFENHGTIDVKFSKLEAIVWLFDIYGTMITHHTRTYSVEVSCGSDKHKIAFIRYTSYSWHKHSTYDTKRSSISNVNWIMRLLAFSYIIYFIIKPTNHPLTSYFAVVQLYSVIAYVFK